MAGVTLPGDTADAEDAADTGRPAKPGEPGEAVPGTASWRLLVSYIRPHRRALLLGGVLSLVGSLAGLAMPLLAKTVVDAFGEQRSLLGPVLGLTAAVLVGAAIGALGSYVLERMGEGIVFSARRTLVDRMLRLRVSEVDRLKPGDLMSRVTSDTTLLRAVFTSGVVETVSSLFMLVGAVVMMAVIDGLLLLITLGVLVVVGGFVSLIMPRIQRASMQAQVAVGEMGAVLDRVLQAFRTVKASGAEEREIAAVGEAAREARDRGIAVAWLTSIAGVSAWVSAQLAFVAVLGVGGARVASGSLEVSSLIAFLLYLFYLVAPIGQLVNGFTQVQNGLAAVKRIREIEELPAEEADGAVYEVGRAPAGVVFEGVRLPVRRRPAGRPRRRLLRGARGRADRTGGALGGGQVHDLRPAGAVLRAAGGDDRDRRPRHRGLAARRAARLPRLRRAGRAGAGRHAQGEPRLRRARRGGGRHLAGARPHPPGGPGRPAPRGAGDQGRPSGDHALRR